MPPRERRRRRIAPLSVALAVGAAGCFALAIGLWATSAISRERTASLSPIEALAEESAPETEATDGDASRDEASRDPSSDPWEGATATYPGLAAWLEVDGTGISTPVMQATDEDPDWFLDHDAFGNESQSGLPYLDAQCETSSAVKTIYAHNLGWGASEGFGSLADAWRQEVFDTIGTLTLASPHALSTNLIGDPLAPEDGTAIKTYYPLCALKVEPDNPSVVHSDDAGMPVSRWLRYALEASDASAERAEVSAELSQAAVVLVTCSGDGYPSESRTVVMFTVKDPDDPLNVEAYACIAGGRPDSGSSQ